MHKLLLLLLAAAACAMALPTGLPPRPLIPNRESEYKSESDGPSVRLHTSLSDLLFSSLMLPGLMNSEDDAQESPDHDWVNKEIEHISKMGNEGDAGIPNYEMDVSNMVVQDNYMDGPSFSVDQTVYTPDGYRTSFFDLRPQTPSREEKTNPQAITDKDFELNLYELSLALSPKMREEQRINFALTPLDKGYFDGINNTANAPSKNTTKSELNGTSDRNPIMAMLITQREIRQNPISNGKQKHLLEPDLAKLKLGLSHEFEGQPNSKMIRKHFTGVATDDSVYTVMILAGAGALLVMVIAGFAYGLYAITKRTKAAADVDYPAYGVTGPQVDNSGDRKLAQSAHMYHYQHQKQQIIAMERNGVDQRTGSVTDPESEEENEEGDYTVYECPGFATTGDMEVKNPLFSDEPTPATPGKTEVMKQQA